MAVVPVVTGSLDKAEYNLGDRVVVDLRENVPVTTIQLDYQVNDSLGHSYTMESKTPEGAVFSALATVAGVDRITAKMTRRYDGSTSTAVLDTRIVDPTPAGAAFPGLQNKVIWGMSAPQNEWDAAWRAVKGAGRLKGRRIFAQAQSSGTSQSNLIRDAISNGLMPVISYSIGGSQQELQACADYLESLRTPVAVILQHEPTHSNVTPANYQAYQKMGMPIFRKKQNISTGCILNGYLLDTQNGRAEFLAFCKGIMDDPALWHWFGIDTYQSGTISNPGPHLSSDRLPLLRQFLQDNCSRADDLRWLIGEFNGFSYDAIHRMGFDIYDKFPEVWCANVWNSSGARAGTLSGDRLQAFDEILADPRHY